MSEHPQTGSIRRTIEDLRSLAAAAHANGDFEVTFLLQQAAQCAEMAVHRLNSPKERQ